MKKLLGKTTFIVGNKKNSGKTTFLNGALEKLRDKGRLAYLSIGVDGETSDQIFGFPKPRVFAKKGDYVVTLGDALQYTHAKFKVLKTFPYSTVLGKPKLIQITGPGFIEIIGPENNLQLSKILECLHKKMRIRTILVDGAINRITQVAAFKDAQFVFICRVDADRVASAADELMRMFRLSKVKKGGSDIVFIRGALTASKAAKIAPDIKKIAVDDLTKVFLSYKELVKLLRSHKLYFKHGFKLAHTVVNLFGVDKREFLKHVTDVRILKKISINEI